MGYINSVGTSCGAGFTRSAYPDSIAIENLVFQAEMNRTNKLMGDDVHRKREGTAIGTFLTLEASGDFLLA